MGFDQQYERKSAMLRNFDWRRHLAGIGVALAVVFFIANYASSPSTSGIREVSPAEASQLIDGGALVVDVRGKEAYDHRHIPGAVNLSDDIAAGIAGMAIARDRPIVVYCGDGVAHGPEGTALLNRAG